jgi:hypothetical protein
MRGLEAFRLHTVIPTHQRVSVVEPQDRDRERIPVTLQRCHGATSHEHLPTKLADLRNDRRPYSFETSSSVISVRE